MKNYIQSSFTSFHPFSTSIKFERIDAALYIRLDFFNGIFTFEDVAMIQTVSHKCRPINYARVRFWKKPGRIAESASDFPHRQGGGGRKVTSAILHTFKYSREGYKFPESRGAYLARVKCEPRKFEIDFLKISNLEIRSSKSLAACRESIAARFSRKYKFWNYLYVCVCVCVRARARACVCV